MSPLKVPFIESPGDAGLLSKQMDGLEKHPVKLLPWPSSYPYAPEVFFAMAWDDRSIMLKFFVTEEEVRIMYSSTNEPVYEDSCVEFFISFDDAVYFNLEFNIAGVCLGQKGPERAGRQFLPKDQLETIQSYTVIRKQQKEFSWELTLNIPSAIFGLKESLDGKKARANLYKCGDGLSKQHYLAWQPVHSTEPDFHLPSFFGGLQFER